MQATAEGFLVFELTHSPAWLGYVGFAAGIPVWLFSSYAGSIADRYPKRTILMITQGVMMALAFSTATLTFLGWITPHLLLFFSFMLGMANTFDAPVRQAFVVEMVGREDLMNAIAINSGMTNGATAVGPAMAGVTYALFGPAWCFTMNGISFIGTLTALYMMKLPPHEKIERKSSIIEDIKDGFRYIKGKPVMLAIILVVAFNSALGLAFATLFPAWAVKVLNGDAATNGFLQSSRGIGSLLGALVMAMLSRTKRMGMFLSISMMAFPVFLLLFSLTDTLFASLSLLLIAGFFLLFVISLSNGLLQLLVADEYRGRVMSVHTMTFFGMTPVGAFIYGQLADHLSAPAAIQICGGILLLFSISMFIFFPRLHHE
ncbi:MAG: Enterobactin exporter EntS [Ignavibacteriaceae bacterium]|nr:Enterobactin exporter EntS [Ignavibacteriaceae bacterium]